MKVGDIIERNGQLGIVTRAETDGHTVHFRYIVSVCGSGIAEHVVLLTPDQRAFVDATIAAEALRRIG